MKIPVFYSYAHVDDAFRAQLEIRLELLRRQNIIEGWSDRKIAPGSNWEEDINFNLKKAQIIILLISPEFLASDYCYETETIFALEQHEKGKAIVVPIIIRPCLWEISNFKHLQVLPRDGKALTLWKNIDEAWLNVSKAILSLIQEMVAKAQRAAEEQTRSIEAATATKPASLLETIIDSDYYLSKNKERILGAANEVNNQEKLAQFEEQLRSFQLNPSDETRVALSQSILKAYLPEEKTPKNKKPPYLLLVGKDSYHEETLTDLLLRFLFSYNDWYFSPLRIQRWGARQLGFEKLGNFSTAEIKASLEDLTKNNQVKVTKSRNGNPIYKLK